MMSIRGKTMLANCERAEDVGNDIQAALDNISYLTWIKFRVDKILRFSRFLIKAAKLNPREIH